MREQDDARVPSLPGWVECFSFPIATRDGRRDVLIGGTWLFTLLFGWVLNLGHRLEVVRRVSRDERPFFRGYSPIGLLLRRGGTAVLAISAYLAPAAVAAVAAPRAWRIGAAAALFVIAVIALPGGMTIYAAHGDPRFLYRPDRSLARALGRGRAYARAWMIGGVAIALSFLGLAALGVGFFYTSVWAWHVVGYAFTRALVLEAPPRAE